MSIDDQKHGGVLAENDSNFVYTAVQLEEIREILADTGYAFDPRQNIFYTHLDPWQRDLGYCSLYDEAAAPLGLVFDCEPVRFDYGGKRWLIELWKGQYGITSGAEIGIYTTTGPDLEIPGVFDGTFYDCADDSDHLSMTYTLLKDNKVLFNRAARHWWLTGFILGEYAEPSELTMEVSITFKDEPMRDAFLRELYEIGYTDKEVRYGSNTVLILFTKPHSKQPLTRSGFLSSFVMQRLKENVAFYKSVTGDMNNMCDIFMTLKENAPVLYNLILNLGRQKELFDMHDTLLKYLT